MDYSLTENQKIDLINSTSGYKVKCYNWFEYTLTFNGEEIKTTKNIHLLFLVFLKYKKQESQQNKFKLFFDETKYNHLPNLKELVNYFENKLDVGDFVRAILENNLIKTFSRADSTNLKLIDDYVTFLYNHCPTDAYGSPEAVTKHLNS